MSIWNNWKIYLRRELRLLFSGLAIPTVMVGGVLLYGFLYNYMYSTNVVREVPIAVVDASTSSLGRRFVLLLDATPQVQVITAASDVIEARTLMDRGVVHGFLYLAPDFAERLGRGEPSVAVTLSSTASFLYYSSVRTASNGALQALTPSLRKEMLLFMDPEQRVALSQSATLPMDLRSLYNITDGYATYLIPAVLMIILFQTLLMVVTMACGMERERGYDCRYLLGRPSWTKMMAVVCGKSSAYLLVYLFLGCFLFFGLPTLFDLPQLASGWEIAALLLPYILATCFLGLSLSPWCTDSEVPLLGITFFSVGLLFLSGISYPLQLMPGPWRALHYVLPASTGTLAYLQLTALGAGMEGIREAYATLWIQTVVYFCLAVWVFVARGKKNCKKRLNNRPECCRYPKTPFTL